MQEADSKLVMVTSFWNILDFLAFFPPLLEICLFHGANVAFTLGQFDLRWFKILRCVSIESTVLCLQDVLTEKRRTHRSLPSQPSKLHALNSCMVVVCTRYCGYMHMCDLRQTSAHHAGLRAICIVLSC